MILPDISATLPQVTDEQRDRALLLLMHHNDGYALIGNARVLAAVALAYEQEIKAMGKKMKQAIEAKDNGMEKSIAHRGNIIFQVANQYPDGLVDWHPAEPPVWPSDNESRTTGRLRSCGYCGSLHPADFAAAIKAGAVAHWADRKHGWPHKAYVDGIPNPHAGMLESRSGCSHPPQAELDAGKWIRVRSGYNSVTGEPQYTYRDSGSPAGVTTHGKFYSVHLQDATPEDRAVIEAHLGLAFEFADGQVSWKQS